jgi:outer membrane lipoprotein-sorting protein
MQCSAKRMRASLAVRTVRLGLAACVILSTGCAGVAPPVVAPAPAPLSAEELVARVQERGAAIQTLRAQFSIEASGKEIRGTQRMEVAMIYQRPDLVRLRAFARIGLPIFDLILINDHYQMKIPMQGKFLTGRMADLDRQEGLGPSVLLGVQATLGNLNGATVSPTDKLSLREADGQYLLEVMPAAPGTVGARRLWFDQLTLELVRQEFLDASGRTQATILFQDYRPVGTIAVGAKGQGLPIIRPYLVRAEDANGRAKLVLTFREIVPNPELSPQDWGIPSSEPVAGSLSLGSLTTLPLPGRPLHRVLVPEERLLSEGPSLGVFYSEAN